MRSFRLLSVVSFWILAAGSGLGGVAQEASAIQPPQIGAPASRAFVLKAWVVAMDADLATELDELRPRERFQRLDEARASGAIPTLGTVEKVVTFDVTSEIELAEGRTLILTLLEEEPKGRLRLSLVEHGADGEQRDIVRIKRDLSSRPTRARGAVPLATAGQWLVIDCYLP